jgi:hypothetical protein
MRAIGRPSREHNHFVTGFHDGVEVRSVVIHDDGHWLSYESNGPIYVQAFPGPGEKWQISTDGGSEPTLWSRNGRELFYENDDKIMVVEIATSPRFTAGKPAVLFQKQFFADSHAPYDVFPDGQRFIAIQPVEPEQPATKINVVLNWRPEPGK